MDIQTKSIGSLQRRGWLLGIAGIHSHYHGVWSDVETIRGQQD